MGSGGEGVDSFIQNEHTSRGDYTVPKCLPSDRGALVQPIGVPISAARCYLMQPADQCCPLPFAGRWVGAWWCAVRRGLSSNVHRPRVLNVLCAM